MNKWMNEHSCCSFWIPPKKKEKKKLNNDRIFMFGWAILSKCWYTRCESAEIWMGDTFLTRAPVLWPHLCTTGRLKRMLLCAFLSTACFRDEVNNTKLTVVTLLTRLHIADTPHHLSRPETDKQMRRPPGYKDQQSPPSALTAICCTSIDAALNAFQSS